MNQILMMIIAAGAVAGGIDRMCGNRLGLGKKFEEGLHYMGPMALCMAGILCLAPLLGQGCRTMIAPLFRALGIDPSMAVNVLAIDMGGYALAVELADDMQVGLYSGVVVSAIFGCTIVFLIPLGMGLVAPCDRKCFGNGVILGLAAMPAGLLTGGLLCGLAPAQVLYQTMPVLVVSLLLGMGLWRFPRQTVAGFRLFAGLINLLATAGLILGAAAYLTGCRLLPGLAPIEEAMTTVGCICVVLMGSLPLTELLQRALRKPFTALGRRLGMNHVSMTGLLIGTISAIPVLTSLKDMDGRGKVMNVAFLVSGTAMFAAHLGFAAANAPDILTAMLAAKAVGAAAAVLAALFVTRRAAS